MKRPGPRREFRLALFCAVSLCIASTPVPFSIQRALIDRIGEIGKTSDSARAAALQLLERLAEARIDSITADLIDTVGLRREQLTGPEFTQPSVRAHALRRIGKLGGAEAVTYLAKLKRSDLGADDSGEMWMARQIAVREAQLSGIPDAPQRTRFLEETAMEKSAAAAWAVEELCNQGSVQSLEVIRRSILKRNPTAAGEKDFNFREARIHVLGRNPDRISSLASALTIANVSSQRDLVGWAINELSALNSPRADGELASFMNELGQEISRTSAGSDLDRDLRSKHFQIGRLLSQRHK